VPNAIHSSCTFICWKAVNCSYSNNININSAYKDFYIVQPCSMSNIKLMPSTCFCMCTWRYFTTFYYWFIVQNIWSFCGYDLLIVITCSCYHQICCWYRFHHKTKTNIKTKLEFPADIPIHTIM
jgi:hypothetical protein